MPKLNEYIIQEASSVPEELQGFLSLPDEKRADLFVFFKEQDDKSLSACERMQHKAAGQEFYGRRDSEEIAPAGFKIAHAKATPDEYPKIDSIASDVINGVENWTVRGELLYWQHYWASGEDFVSKLEQRLQEPKEWFKHAKTPEDVEFMHHARHTLRGTGVPNDVVIEDLALGPDSTLRTDLDRFIRSYNSLYYTWGVQPHKGAAGHPEFE